MSTNIHSNNTPATIGNSSSCHNPCQRGRSVDSSNDGSSDEFIGSASQTAVAVSEEAPQTSLNGIISTICNLGNSLCEIGGIFSPVVSFVKNLFSGTQSQSNEQIIEGFSSLLHATSEQAGGLLSNESRSALSELTSTVENLQQSNGNVNLGSIIARWRETRDAQHLLQIAEQLENGACGSLSAEEVRELRSSFVNGLRTLTRAIRDAENRNEPEALEYLHRAADSLVCGVERADEACQRENPRLTCDDRAFMRGRLQECCDHIQEGRQSGAFHGLDHSICNELYAWADYTLNYLQQTEEEERARKEEEERREQCEERCEQESLREYLHVLHKRAEAKKLYYRSLMRRAQLDLEIERARVRSQAIRTNSRLLLSEILLQHGRANAAESLARFYEGSEFGLMVEEGIISESMLPASVCEQPVLSGMGGSFNLCC